MPQQVEVIGFDNVEVLIPSLSAIVPDYDMMARRAVDLLAGRIE
ncbi:substrate-binding domain-containing protein [Streptomyces sp. NBC_00268]|nr:substrate-binding domain-containing protein [Streptomyces sp. NBC_00268]